MKKRVGRFFIYWAILCFIPFSAGAPEMKDITGATEFVSATDYIRFPSGPDSLFIVGTRITLNSPDGDQMSWVKPLGGIGPGQDFTEFYLSGAAKAGDTGSWQGIPGHSVVGAPSNGTWTITVENPAGGYEANEYNPDPSLDDNIQLFVGSKSIEYSTFTSNSQDLQLWNYHETSVTWREPSTDQMAAPDEDPIDEANEEDPDLAVYYGPGEFNSENPSQPSVETTRANPDCGTSRISPTAVFAAGATQDAGLPFYGFFSSIDGTYTGNNVTMAPGSTDTNLVNLTGNLFGTFGATPTIPYNNLIGTSYQAYSYSPQEPGNWGKTRVIIVPPFLCSQLPPDLGSFNHDEADFEVDVSQGQCSIDNTTIAAQADNVISGGDTLDFYLLDADTGMSVMTWSHTEFYGGPAGQYFWLSTYIPPGDWALLGVEDQMGLGSNDHYDIVAFNVKEGPCTKTTLGDITFEIENALLEILINNTQEHRDASLELMGMDFEGIGFDGFLILIALLVLLAVTLWHGYTFLVLVSSIGSALVFFEVPTIGFAGIVYLLIIGALLEYFVGGLKSLGRRGEDEETPW